MNQPHPLSASLRNWISYQVVLAILLAVPFTQQAIGQETLTQPATQTTTLDKSSGQAETQRAAPPTDTLILIAPLESKFVYLTDATGKILHQWEFEITGSNAYLFPDGSIMRSAQVPEIELFDGRGSAGRIQKLDWHGKLVWDFKYADETVLQHHDFEVLPNGNVLFIAWEKISTDEAIKAGRDPELLEQNELYSEKIVEVKPTGLNGAEQVWQWRLWDHLIQSHDESLPNYGMPSENPRRMNVNFCKNGRADWIHMNAVDYNADLDQIILSPRYTDEFWIIDHSTTTEEAASSSGGKYGHGGDFLYRMGNPMAYAHGTPEDKLLFGQHNCMWIPNGFPGEGDITTFNNGTSEPRTGFSSADQFQLPTKTPGVYRMDDQGAYEAPELVWSYSRGEEMFSGRIGGVERLANGNTLICSGDQPWILEIAPDKTVVWDTQRRYGGADGNTPNRERGDMFRSPGYATDFLAPELREELSGE